MKYLAHFIIHDNKLYTNSTCHIQNDDEVIINPFSVETAGTTFVNGVIVVSALDLSPMLGTFHAILKNATDIKSGATEIMKIVNEKAQESTTLSKKNYILPIYI